MQEVKYIQSSTACLFYRKRCLLSKVNSHYNQNTTGPTQTHTLNHNFRVGSLTLRGFCDTATAVTSTSCNTCTNMYGYMYGHNGSELENQLAKKGIGACA